MLQNANSRWLMPVFFTLVALVAAGCGGGGATIVVQQTPSPDGGGSTTGARTIPGSGFKGPFKEGGLVQAFRVTAAGQKLQPALAVASTDSSGSFSLSITDASYAGPVLLELTGSYFDEGTGVYVPTGANPLRGAAILPARANADPTRITALTHLAIELAKARLDVTESGLNQAFGEMERRFGVLTPQFTQPLDTRGAIGSDPNANKYGLVLAGISQAAALLDVSTNELLFAAARDASDETLDGSLDGLNGPQPILMPTKSGTTATYDNTALTSRLSAAIEDFVTRSPSDGTNLTASSTIVGELKTVINRVNSAPTASFDVNPPSANVGATIVLDGRSSRDPDNEVPRYSWTVSVLGVDVAVSGSSSAQASFVPGVAGDYVVTLVVRDGGGLTGTSTKIVRIGQPPAQSAARIDIGIVAAAVSSPAGQTTRVSIPVGNSGGRAANVSRVTITFTGTSALLVAARSTNPPTIAAGITANYEFDVTVPSGTTEGRFDINAQVSATDAGSGQSVGASRSAVGRLTVLPPGSVPSVQPETLVPSRSFTQGEVTILSLPVTNPGTQVVDVRAASLTFDDTNIQASLLPDSPARISPGAGVTLRFSTAIGVLTRAGNRTASALVTARTVGTLLNADGSSSSVGGLTVVNIAKLRVTNLTLSPSVVSRGANVTASFVLASIGGAAADLSSVALDVGGTRVQPTPPSVPDPMAVGITSTVSFQFNTASLPLGALTVVPAVTAIDSTSNSQPVPVLIEATPPVLTVQSPAKLSIVIAEPLPGTAVVLSQGQSQIVTLTVRNLGTAGSSPTTATLTFLSGTSNVSSEFAVTPSGSNPTGVAGEEFAAYRFGVVPQPGNLTGTVNVVATLSGKDVNDASPVQPSSITMTWTIQTPGKFELGTLDTQTDASQGQSFLLSQKVLNRGGAALLNVRAGLVASGTGLTVTTVAAPTTIAGGGSANYQFRVDVDAGASPGSRTLQFDIAGKDANSGAASNLSNSSTVSIETPALLVLGSLLSPATISLGQEFDCFVPVTNRGQAAAVITTAFLVFSSGSATVLAVTAPLTISGVTTASVRFRVRAESTASPGTPGATFGIFGYDENSGQPISLDNQSVGTINLVAPGALAVTGMIVPSKGSQGGTETIIALLENTGGNSVTGIAPVLSVSGDVSSTVPTGPNPQSLLAGETGSYSFDVTFDITAATGPRTIGFTATGTEAGTGVTVAANPTGTGTLTVQTPASPNTISVISSKSIVTRGQTFTASLSVQNTGEATANISSVTLSFSGNGLNVTPDANNPGTIAGKATETFVYAVAVSPTADLGPQTASVAVVATDANSGASSPGGRAVAGTVNVQTPPALAVTGFAGATKGNRNQQGLVVTFTIGNTGQAQASITSATLTMASGVIASILTPLPLVIGGVSGTGQLQFSLSIGTSATLGTGQMTARAFAIDNNSELPAPVTAASSNFQVQSRVNLTPGDVSIVSSPSGLDRNGAAVTVKVRVRNGANGDVATARISSSSVLTFGAFSTQYGVSNPLDLLTRDILGGTFEDFDFQVTALSTAEKAQNIPVTAAVTVTDQNDSALDSESGPAIWVVRDRAEGVLGQADLASGSPNRGSAAAENSVNMPSAVATDGTNVAVADTTNNRVLIFTSLAGTAATKVVGQANFTSTGAGTSAAQLSAPQGVFFDRSNRLGVVDTGNHRVLVFSDIATLQAVNGAAARVFGQADANSGLANRGIAAAANSLNSPSDAAVENDTLFIADTANNRVLMFAGYNALVTAGTDGPAATRVIGQINGSDTLANQGVAASGSTLSGPTSVATTGLVRLAIADTGNNRVLVYSDFTAFAGNGPAASGVLGQSTVADFSANRANTVPARNTLAGPTGVRFGFSSLFISDTDNHRVVAYSGTATTGDTATDLLGQALYDTASNANTVDGTVRDGYSFFRPTRLATIGSSRLFVADQLNHRVLRFTLP